MGQGVKELCRTYAGADQARARRFRRCLPAGVFGGWRSWSLRYRLAAQLGVRAAWATSRGGQRVRPVVGAVNKPILCL